MSVLDELNQSLLSQKEISNLVSVEKPDFHFIINSRGHCLDFSEHKMKFEINLFLFLDNLPFVRDYLKLVKYGTDREHFYFGFCVSLNIISYSEFARFVRGIFGIKQQFAKSLSYERDIFAVFKRNADNSYSNDDKCIVTLSQGESFQYDMERLYHYMFGNEINIQQKERAICIYDDSAILAKNSIDVTGHQLNYIHPVKLVRKYKNKMSI